MTPTKDPGLDTGTSRCYNRSMMFENEPGYIILRGFTETRTGREIPLYHVVDPRDGCILDSFRRRYIAKYYCDRWNSRDFPQHKPLL